MNTSENGEIRDLTADEINDVSGGDIMGVGATFAVVSALVNAVLAVADYGNNHITCACDGPE